MLESGVWSVIRIERSKKNLRIIRLRNYKDDLLERLKDPEYTAAYFVQVLKDGDKNAFLIALRDIVEAGGGMSVMAPHNSTRNLA
jgi:DNA-binding phage protein